MSTRQSIAGVAPRLRVGLGAGFTALGVLVAVAVAVIILALTGASRTTSATPTAHGFNPAHAPVMQRYLTSPATTVSAERDQLHGRGIPQAPAASNPAAATDHTCVFIRAEHRCVR